MPEMPRDTARRYIADDIRDAVEHVDDVTRLLPHARLDEPDELDELVNKLAVARGALLAAQGAFEEAVHA